jgi:hypothetical protein
MRKVFITGVGSLLVSGLLVTPSGAGTFKSDMICSGNSGVGKVSITASGTVKGSLQLIEPLVAEVKLDCEISCGPFVAVGPAPCIDAPAGATTMTIKAPGLGATLAGTCLNPAVEVVGFCHSAYIPPGS